MDKVSKRRNKALIRNCHEFICDSFSFATFNFKCNLLKRAKIIELHSRVIPESVKLSLEELFELQKLVGELGGLGDWITLEIHFTDGSCYFVSFYY